MSGPKKKPSSEPTFTATGFRNCTQLDNSQYDSTGYIIPFKGSYDENAFETNQFVELVDKTAEGIMNHYNQSGIDLGSLERLHRYSCYWAATGLHNRFKLSDTRLLKRTDPMNYFKSHPSFISAYGTPNNIPQPPPPALDSEEDTKETITALTPAEEKVLEAHNALPAKPKYGLAYLILMHGLTNLPAVKDLIEELDDGSALIMLHVDPNGDGNTTYAEMKRWVEKRGLQRLLPGPRTAEEWMEEFPGDSQAILDSFKVDGTGSGEIVSDSKKKGLQPENKQLARREQSPPVISGKGPEKQQQEQKQQPMPKVETSKTSKPIKRRNVFLSKERFEGRWGDISLVWMQLGGFFELAQIADWDFVINMSANDYPLRSSREMHRWLSKAGNNGTGYMNYSLLDPYFNDEVPVRISNTDPYIEDGGFLPPPFPSWTSYKHSQWNILSRSFINHMQRDWKTFEALAWAEFHVIPDEHFFGLVLMNSPEFKDKVIKDNKRLAYFDPNEWHPSELDITWAEYFFPENAVGEEPPFFHVRKIKANSPSGRELLAWIREKHIDKHDKALAGKG
ncbi:hypothetical protein HDV05_004225 [Chytridiales sp. JEL 0842]|nr:hypothetical protein HDV05_004225 [Chytridiales sp. JEL 0842]